ncbi:MAG: endonuclease [Frankiales bacterium]|nr:endonuclease [Frankiales bacterium]
MGQTGWLEDPRYDACLDELAALQGQESALFAARARVLAQLAARTSREGWQAEAPFDSLVLDVAGTCTLGQVAASSRLTDAEHLVVRLPGTAALLESGRLAVHQAQVLVGETRDLAPEVCAEVERRVLSPAPLLCPADLRRLVKRTVLSVDASERARREAEALQGRRVWTRPAEDGMTMLYALLPAEQAQRLHQQLTEQARAAAGPDEARTRDQLRADLLVAAVCGETGPGRATVQAHVHVPLAVALGASDDAAELEGHGPISAAHARRLLDDADLRRVCVDPETGEVWSVDRRTTRVRSAPTPSPQPSATDLPLRPVVGRQESVPPSDFEASDGSPPGAQRLRPDVRAALLALADLPPPALLSVESQYEPSRPLARLVRARDVRCDGIGCSVPASRCELDHDVPWPDGPTSPGNLTARSQRCHHAKHHGWTAVRDPAGTTWTSPGGRTYRVLARSSRAPGLSRGPGGATASRYPTCS